MDEMKMPKKNIKVGGRLLMELEKQLKETNNTISILNIVDFESKQKAGNRTDRGRTNGDMSIYTKL